MITSISLISTPTIIFGFVRHSFTGLGLHLTSVNILVIWMIFKSFGFISSYYLIGWFSALFLLLLTGPFSFFGLVLDSLGLVLCLVAISLERLGALGVTIFFLWKNVFICFSSFLNQFYFLCPCLPRFTSSSSALRSSGSTPSSSTSLGSSSRAHAASLFRSLALALLARVLKVNICKLLFFEITHFYLSTYGGSS
jgi:hypothetical protein